MNGGYSKMHQKKQAVVYTLGNIVYLLTLWLFTVITTRLLGYEAAGNLSLATALGNVFFFIQLFGVRAFQSTDMAFLYMPRAYLRARLITCAAGLLLCALCCILLGYSAQVALGILLYLGFRSSEAVSEVMFGDIQRAGRLEFVGYSLALRGIMTALLYFAGAYLFRSVSGALALTAAGALLLTLFLDVSLYRKAVPDPGRTSAKEVFALLRDCAPLLVTSLIPLLITAVPRMVLERDYGAELLGFYGNVSTPALVLTTVVPTFVSSFFTRYGALYLEGDYRGIRNLWLKTVFGTVALGAVCALGVLVLGKPLMAFVYTERIVPYVRYLYPILAAMALYGLTMCSNTVLVTVRKSKHLIFAVAVALAVCLAISVPLVRAHGIPGAIAALAIPYGAQTLLQVIWILRICRRGEKSNHEGEANR